MRDFDRDAVRTAILDAALTHVPFDGWTDAALAAGAHDAGHDAAMALRVFPGGPVEAIEFWCETADRRMLAALATQDLAAMKVRERVALAVRLRLEGEAGRKEAVRRALAVLAMPHRQPLAARTLWRTVDAVWHAAGDRSTDWNYYTKRGLLAGVYSATLLYWLDDRSPGGEATWGFLDRRIAEVMTVPRALGEIGRRIGALPNPFALLRKGASRLGG